MRCNRLSLFFGCCFFFFPPQFLCFCLFESISVFVFKARPVLHTYDHGDLLSQSIVTRIFGSAVLKQNYSLEQLNKVTGSDLRILCNRIAQKFSLPSPPSSIFVLFQSLGFLKISGSRAQCTCGRFQIGSALGSVRSLCAFSRARSS